MSEFEAVILVLVLVLLARNFRKDRSDGRGLLGGWKGTGGDGTRTHQK